MRQLRVSPHHRLNLSSNDYFQMGTHPQVLEASVRALQTWGAGSGASPLLGGYLSCHEELLEGLKSWIGKPEGLLFNTGFTLNQALVRHLVGPKDLVLTDRHIHHSIAQALSAGKTRFHRFHHGDLRHLEQLILQNRERCETLFVVTESVYSMDGDCSDLKAIAEIKSRHPFVWILDEAHALGTYGATGAGLAEEEKVLDAVDIFVGTLGKALGTMGGFLLTSNPDIVDYLVNQAGEFIYSTYLNPPAAAGAAEALKLLRSGRDEARRLRSLGRDLRSRLSGAGWKTLGSDSPIVPLVPGDVETVLGLQKYFQDHGVLVSAVRPPTVPKGTARLRISLHTGVQKEDLDRIMDLLESWKGC